MIFDKVAFDVTFTGTMTENELFDGFIEEIFSAMISASAIVYFE